MIKTILIADDSPVARKILKSCFPKDNAYEFHEVGDGLAAVEKYQEISPDVTFLDLTMPVMDGLAALERIKDLHKNALIIVATADVQKRTMERARELGAFMLLKKPPSKEAVQNALSAVEKILDRRK
jgi:two-component system chemotaxis response regulator CheY